VKLDFSRDYLKKGRAGSIISGLAPGMTKPEKKSSFVKKSVVRGEVFIVGTGIYFK
jgi:hypothetical protein